MISIVVPVYNVEKYINRCLDSIINQTYYDFELILVDDGSTDSCAQICDNYASCDNRIHVIHKDNGGLSSARNVGIEWILENSSSEWITFVDSDDIVHPQMLELLSQYADDKKNKLIVGDFHHFDRISEIDDLMHNNFSGEVEYKKPEDFFVESSYIETVAWGKLYHRDCFRELRYPEGKLNEDLFVTYKIIFSLDSIVHVKCPIYYYCDSNFSSITKSKWRPKKLDAFEGYSEQISFFENNKYSQARAKIVYRYAEVLFGYILQAREIAKYKKIYKKMQKMMRHHLKKYRDVKSISFKTNKYFYLVAHPIFDKIYNFLKYAVILTHNGRIKPLGKLFFKYKIYKKIKKQRDVIPEEYPVDFVVTWVDENDTEWKKEKDFYLSKHDNQTKSDNTKERFRDWEVFRYWFRAVEKYAPWVRKIFVVTYGHIPEWLNTDSSKIRIINHADFIPKRYLPTFNSHTIENNLWRIRDLSEHFIYFNDDMYLASNVKKEDFFYNGYPKLCSLTKPNWANNKMCSFEHTLWNVLGEINSYANIRSIIKEHPEKWLNMRLKDYYEYNSRTYEDNYLSGLFFSHLPVPYRKSSIKKCYQTFESKMDKTCSNKFRSYQDLCHPIFQAWEMINSTFEPVETEYYGQFFRINKYHIDDVEKQLLNNTYKCICLNDDRDIEGDEFDELKKRIHKILDTKLPEKSSFEL